jgi:toxin secretion/phage lysis holin
MEYTVDQKRGGEGTVKHYMVQLADGFEWKILSSIGISIVTWVSGFYGDLLWAFLGLFALDLVSGIMKSKYNGIPIVSKKLRASVTKLGAYMVLVTSLIIAGKFEPAFVHITSVCYYYYCFTELKSILENVGEMGVKIPSFLTGTVNAKIEQYDKDSTETTKEPEYDSNADNSDSSK